MLKNTNKTNPFNGKTVPVFTEGWYWKISLLPVPRTDSLNSLAEALATIYLRSADSTWQHGDFLGLVADTQHCMDTGETLAPGRWLLPAALASCL